MKSPKTYVILFLAVTTIGGAILAWQQYGELVELRAAAMNKDERADLQKRVWDLEKLNRALQDQLAASRDPNAGRENLVAGADGERPPNDRGGRGGPPGGRGDPRERANSMQQQARAIFDLYNKPEVQAMLSLQQKAGIEQRYSSLFKNLNLPPDQVDKLKALLVERSTTLQDVMAAAREQGIDPRDNPDSFRKMISDAQNEVNKGIKATIGDSGFAQLTNYEQTLPQRNLVNDLQQRLSYTNSPLTPSQAEQMINILAANAPSRQEQEANRIPGLPNPGGPQGGRDGGRGPGGGFPGPGPGGPDLGAMIAGVLGGGPGVGIPMGGPGFDGGGRGSGAVTVTLAAVIQAQSVLAPPQLAALQQIQQQQQTQQQLRNLVNETLTANQPANPNGPGPNNPPRKRGGGGE